MNDTFMKERPVLPLIISMALPMVISMLVNSLYNIVDSFFVAQISEDAMTALSLVYPMQNLINAIAIGFGVGINAQIAFHLGAGNRDRASAAATHGTALAALHGVLLTVVSIATIRWFLGMFTADGAVIDLGVRYSRIAFAFSAVISIELAYEKLFQAAGRMKLTMLSMLSGCVANIILDPVLIFGIGPFPALGIEGAAIATGLGQVLTLIVYLIVYARFPIPVRISRRFLTPDRQLDLKLYSVGIPAALNLALPSVMISALNTILAAWSQSYIVILGVYYKLQTFLYLPASGIVQGMRPVIGYNYGAGEKRRVAQIYRVTLALCSAIMVLGTAICLLVPDLLIGLFTENPDTVLAGGMALRIICAGFVVSSVSVTSSGALEGIGKGFPSLIISLCRYIVVILPAAFLLSRLLGPTGVWHAFWITEFITAFVSFAVYRRQAGRL
ncbi:MATE family efflux transporter [Mordavella massiliensis]|uniref:Probable multidrug resistance protein NorM n=1 Tax=Mordavella massiliensis TaxID=1871024 RepID=A0A939BGN1_9CLOT|nr:MATE family efflux transporter [Mordavella massiliensis]MBM6947876.1 MATE family efflux transporter [Mordavella massiliensis]